MPYQSELNLFSRRSTRGCRWTAQFKQQRSHSSAKLYRRTNLHNPNFLIPTNFSSIVVFVFINSKTSFKFIKIQRPHFCSKSNKMHQCIKFILFWNDTLHVSDSLSVHHQQFKTVHTAVKQIRKQSAVSV